MHNARLAQTQFFTVQHAHQGRAVHVRVSTRIFTAYKKGGDERIRGNNNVRTWLSSGGQGISLSSDATCRFTNIARNGKFVGKRPGNFPRSTHLAGRCRWSDLWISTASNCHFLVRENYEQSFSFFFFVVFSNFSLLFFFLHFILFFIIWWTKRTSSRLMLCAL